MVNIQLAGQLKEALASFLFLASLVRISSVMSMNYNGLLRSLLVKNKEALVGVTRNTEKLSYVYLLHLAACEERDRMSSD